MALSSNTTESSNTAEGIGALVGNTTGSNNIALGANAGGSLTTGNNNIDIGNFGVPDESNTIRIGTPQAQTATFIGGIRGTPITGGVAVRVTSSGQLGVKPSSVRFKEAIKPMDKASEAILELKPVSTKRSWIQPARRSLAWWPKRWPRLMVIWSTDEKGRPFTVRYEEVNAMLLNEFLKEHRKGKQQDRKIEELERAARQQDSTVTELRSQVQALTAALQQQAAQIQKVSAQLELSKFATQMVWNDQ